MDASLEERVVALEEHGAATSQEVAQLTSASSVTQHHLLNVLQRQDSLNYFI